MSIPCSLTAVADEFGGDIPCTPYVNNEGDHIVQAILANRSSSPAVLLGRHGVIPFKDSPRAAFKATVMVEDVDRTLLLANYLGKPATIPEDEIKNGGAGTIHHTDKVDLRNN